MQVLDYSVREPTGKAWVITMVGLIAAGELAWDMSQDKPSSFFGVRLADSEVLVLSLVFAGLAVVGLVWLIGLYLRPGRLILDLSAGTVRRRRRRLLRTVEAGGALGDLWTLRAVFFSDLERERGVFKRLELRGPDYSEVILWTDVPGSAELVRDLRAAAPPGYSETGVASAASV